jgi:hypothetical protein
MEEMVLRFAPWVLGIASGALVALAAVLVTLLAMSFRAELRDETRDPGQ